MYYIFRSKNDWFMTSDVKSMMELYPITDVKDLRVVMKVEKNDFDYTCHVPEETFRELSEVISEEAVIVRTSPSDSHKFTRIYLVDHDLVMVTGDNLTMMDRSYDSEKIIVTLRRGMNYSGNLLEVRNFMKEASKRGSWIGNELYHILDAYIAGQKRRGLQIVESPFTL